jgi:DNA polymerase V
LEVIFHRRGVRLAHGHARQPDDYGARLRATVTQWTGHPRECGHCRHQTLAKLANRLAKAIPAGVYDLVDHPEMDRLLEGIRVGQVWGVGFRHSRRLQALGVRNARQLRDLDKTSGCAGTCRGWGCAGA